MRKFEKVIKKLGVLVLGTTLAVGLTACGGSNASTNSGATTVTVGMGNAWAPADYIDENGNPAGYEYEVLKAVDELLPQYEFVYQPMDFPNILVALDTGKIDVASHTFTVTEERAQKYAYTDESHYVNSVLLVISKDNDKVHTIEDLAGKTLFAATGEASATWLENYNKENPDKAVKLKYENFTMEQVVAEISNGTTDAWYCNQAFLNDLNNGYGNKLKAADGGPLYSVNSVYYIDKNKTELKEAIDGAIKTLRENGTLTELSNKFYGYDISGASN